MKARPVEFQIQKLREEVESAKKQAEEKVGF